MSAGMVSGLLKALKANAVRTGAATKAAAYHLKRNPTYADALKVFNKLDFDDRANITPRHPGSLREVPSDFLFSRQVAVDGAGNPVGFQEFYLRRDKRGRKLPPHNIVAVVPFTVNHNKTGGTHEG